MIKIDIEMKSGNIEIEMAARFHDIETRWKVEEVRESPICPKNPENGKGAIEMAARFRDIETRWEVEEVRGGSIYPKKLENGKSGVEIAARFYDMKSHSEENRAGLIHVIDLKNGYRMSSGSNHGVLLRHQSLETLEI